MRRALRRRGEGDSDRKLMLEADRVHVRDELTFVASMR